MLLAQNTDVPAPYNAGHNAECGHPHASWCPLLIFSTLGRLSTCIIIREDNDYAELDRSGFQPKLHCCGKEVIWVIRRLVFSIVSSFPGRKAVCAIISILFNPKQWQMIFRGLPCDAAGCSPVSQSMDRTVNLVRGWLTPSQGASCAVTSAPTTPSEAMLPWFSRPVLH